MRKVFERLEGSAVPYFLTGTEALARCGQPRQTMDIDIVLGIVVGDFQRLARRACLTDKVDGRATRGLTR